MVENGGESLIEIDKQVGKWGTQKNKQGGQIDRQIGGQVRWVGTMDEQINKGVGWQLVGRAKMEGSMQMRLEF